MSETKITSVRLKKNTLERLKALGHKGESYEDIVLWLLENCKKKRLLCRVGES